jgi:putative membrane protein
MPQTITITPKKSYMKTSILHFALILLFASAIISCNSQGDRSNNNESDTISLSDDNNQNIGMNDAENDDAGFMEKAAYSGLLEVELGRYAQQNGVNPRVKNFGAMMVRDHTKANDQLKALAAQKNVTLPVVLDQDHLDKANKVKEKKGVEFDKEYMSHMIDMHSKDIDMFRRQSENNNDQILKDFAAKLLPTLITHQDSARKINDAIK